MTRESIRRPSPRARLLDLGRRAKRLAPAFRGRAIRDPKEVKAIVRLLDLAEALIPSLKAGD